MSIILFRPFQEIICFCGQRFLGTSMRLVGQVSVRKWISFSELPNVKIRIKCNWASNWLPQIEFRKICWYDCVYRRKLTQISAMNLRCFTITVWECPTQNDTGHCTEFPDCTCRLPDVTSQHTAANYQDVVYLNLIGQLHNNSFVLEFEF